MALRNFSDASIGTKLLGLSIGLLVFVLGSLSMVFIISELRASRQALTIGFAGLAACLLVAILLALRLRKIASDPVRKLASAIEKIAHDGDFSVRVPKQNSDELGILTDSFNQVLEQIQQRDAAIRQSEQRYKSLVIASNKVVWTMDAEGRNQTDAQPSWEAYTGQPQAEARGVGWLNSIHHADQVAMREAWVRAKSLEIPFEFEGRLHHAASNGYRWFFARAVPIRAEDGQITEWVGAIADIDAQRRTEESLRHTAADLARSNDELEQFAYVVSHDLKAPLRAIASLSEWIHDDYYEALDEEGRENLDLLIGRARRMQDLVEGILRYSRAGRDKATLEPLDSGEVLGRAIDAVAPPPSIRIEKHGTFPDITFDAAQLEQVFQNLVDNAVKHLGKATGQITISCHEEPGEWHFCVKDDGIGIATKHFERIFKMFQTLKPRDELESTGIGLALVKRIVERYGGTLSVESEPGLGATFTFTVPKELNLQTMNA
ncbi:MAG: PAS domain S-box-containing protein [Hyphomicrobiaceae bacterium]